jgi:hypothetical protein
MQQPHLGEVTIYADIAEVRMETRAADCKKLLADGWVLLGVYPRQRLGRNTARPGGRGRNSPRDTQRYVRRLVGYVVGKRREQ